MHCLCDAPSVERYLASPHHAELHPLIRARLDDLADFGDIPLERLVHFFILEPNDGLASLDQALARSFANIPIEACIRHLTWFELTVIAGDDGFGYLIYIPTTTEDCRLAALCAHHASLTPHEDS